MKRYLAPLLPLLTGLLCAPSAFAEKSPVKVYILSGQSNMVGIGQVTGGSKAWSEIVKDPVLSLYPGTPDPSQDYDKMEATKTMEIASFGRNNEPLPGEGVRVVRGNFQMTETGVYEFAPGWAGSKENILVVDGQEVYRKEPKGEATSKPIKLEGGKKIPFMITYLNDDGNPSGWFFRLDVPGTLKSVVNYDGKFKYLVDKDGNFVPRDDVWYKGVVTATGNKWLNIGCGASDSSIGPELGFGHKVGNFHDEPVLLLKASQGNRSLSWDFLPPGSKSFEHTDEDGKTWVYAGYKESPNRWEKGTQPVPIDWYAGKEYDECFDAAKEVLANFDKHFPHWAGRGYEIAGFGWWQGHKDGGEQGSGSAGVEATKYEENLVQLIQTLRKEFKAPDAPFVVTTVGFNGGKGWEPGSSADTIFKAQMNVGDPARHPEFKGTVKSVDIRDFYRSPEVSPRNQSFHYNGNAETYMLVGEAMGEAMIELEK